MLFSQHPEKKLVHLLVHMGFPATTRHEDGESIFGTGLCHFRLVLHLPLFRRCLWQTEAVTPVPGANPGDVIIDALDLDPESDRRGAEPVDLAAVYCTSPQASATTRAIRTLCADLEERGCVPVRCDLHIQCWSSGGLCTGKEDGMGVCLEPVLTAPEELSPKVLRLTHQDVSGPSAWGLQATADFERPRCIEAQHLKWELCVSIGLAGVVFTPPRPFWCLPERPARWWWGNLGCLQARLGASWFVTVVWGTYWSWFGWVDGDLRSFGALGFLRVAWGNAILLSCHIATQKSLFAHSV